ncbi:MAG: histidinol-phosphate transaminase [Deltaproteobacteria bacterium]|nr:histidinol-phosphate transaminase [Deltaproteobacteria bacterium]
MKDTAVPLDQLVPEHIKGFEAYIPSQPDDMLKKLYGLETLHRLNNNENPLGPAPAAWPVLENFPPREAAIYPSGDAWHLRRALGERFGLDPDQFIVGNGANEVIAFVIKAFCREGDNIVTADKTFAVYEWVAEFSGFKARLVPLKDFAFDPETMLSAIDERTKIIFICNPNNPTGTWWKRDQLEAFLERVGGRRIVVLDEAYCEFVEDDEFPDGIEFLQRYPNLVTFRTFSKMYGLAGLRIGYLAGSREVVDIIRRTCVVYSINTLAQAAALEAVNDDDHVRRTRDHIAGEKRKLLPRLEKLGLEYQSDAGCFVMIRLPFSDTLAYRKFMFKGIMIRSMTGFRFPNWIRVSIGSSAAMEAFATALEEIIA